jgi:hypothetical protein
MGLPKAPQSQATMIDRAAVASNMRTPLQTPLLRSKESIARHEK